MSHIANNEAYHGAAPGHHVCRRCGAETAQECAENDCNEFYEDRDPTPWCTGCGAKRKEDCHCGPIAENE